MVALHVRGEPPDGQQPGGEMGVREAACQAQACLDERHRGVLLPLAQQDAGTDVQQVGEQVVVPGSPASAPRRHQDEKGSFLRKHRQPEHRFYSMVMVIQSMSGRRAEGCRKHVVG